MSPRGNKHMPPGPGRPRLSPGQPSVTMAWLRVPLSLSVALRRLNRNAIREWLGRLVQEKREQADQEEAK